MSSADAEYVSEILRAMPAGVTRQDFRSRCQPDRNAGYAAEVDAAERAYFEGSRRSKDKA